MASEPPPVTDTLIHLYNAKTFINVSIAIQAHIIVLFCFILFCQGWIWVEWDSRYVLEKKPKMNWTYSVGSLRSYCSHRKSQFTSLRWTKLRFITEEHTGVLSEPELHAHVSVTCWGIIHPPRIPDWEEARFTQTEWEIWRERETE